MTNADNNRESRHGKVQDGWIRQGIQLPEHLRELIRVEADRRGQTCVKVLGTAAMCLYFGLPEDRRDQLFKIVIQQIWDGAQDIDPEQIVDQIFGGGARPEESAA